MTAKKQEILDSIPPGWQTYKRLLRYLRPVWWAFTLGIIGNIGFAGVEAGVVAMIKPLLDEGFIAQDKEIFRSLPFYLLGIVLLRGVMGFLSAYWMEYAGSKIVMNMRQDLFQHLVYLPTRFYDHNTSGQLLAKITYNTSQVADACTDALKTVVREGATVIFLAGLMFYYSWKLASLLLVIAPLIVLLIRYASHRFRILSRRIQEAMGSITHRAEEALMGSKVIKIFSGQAEEINSFNSLSHKIFKQQMKVVVTKAISSPAVQFLVSIVLAMVIYLASLQSMENTISAGTFVSMIVALMGITHPLKKLTEINKSLQAGIAAAEGIFSVLDEEKEKDGGSSVLQSVKDNITYRNVAFSYREDGGLVLRDISFSVRQGEVVALVGRSGSGKTTLVSLLPRLYEHYEGSVLIDGTEIRQYTLDSLRKQISLVSQNVTLFNASVMENIAYGNRTAVGEEELLKIAEASYVTEFAKGLPQGLDTVVGENGVTLSGGQRQRIAIARALLKDAPILILDEATSALDTESERYIQEALSGLIRNRTTFVIAHRLSTIEKADRILVLEKGELVEQGSHQQLLSNNSQYAKLHRMQFQDAAATT